MGTQVVDADIEVEDRLAFSQVEVALKKKGAVVIVEGHLSVEATLTVLPVEGDLLIAVAAIVEGGNDSLGLYMRIA